jgi:uncharacterized protein YxeA
MMKISLTKLILLLAFMSNSAIAKWTFVTSGEATHMKIYVDYSKIPEQENLVTMWDMSNYKSTQETTDAKFLSSKSESEYNCTERTTRVIAITNYSGHMGSGRIMYSSSDNPNKSFDSIEPKSIAEKLWEIACKQK